MAQARPPMLFGWKIFCTITVCMFVAACATEFKATRIPSSNIEREEVFQEIISKFSKSRHAIGAAAIFIEPDGRIFRANYGTIDNKKDPFTTQTKFPIGSVTKSFTALWFLRTQNKHGLVLSDKIILGDTSTKISDLFGHSAGLASSLHAGMYSFKCPNHRLTTSDFAPYLKNKTAGHYRYSNLGYELIASYASERMETQFESSMMSELKRIGLNEISWMDCNHPPIPGFVDGKSIPHAYLRDLAAGGLVASADDLSLYVESLIKNRTLTGEPLLSEPDWNSLFTDQIPQSTESFGLKYGMGWNLNGIGSTDGEQIIWHRGGTFPYQATVAFLPRRGAAFIYLSNTQETSGVFPLVRHIFEVMSGSSVAQDPYVEKKINPTEWIGEYVGLNDQLVSIKANDKSLKAELLGNKAVIERKDDHWVPYITKLWGLIKISLGDELSVDFVNSSSDRALVLRGWGQPLPIVQLKNEEAMLNEWQKYLGEYELVHSNSTQAVFLPKKLTLENQGGRVIAKVMVQNPAIGDAVEMLTPLHILTDTTAVTAQEGLLLDASDRDQLVYSGFRFKKSGDK